MESKKLTNAMAVAVDLAKGFREMPRINGSEESFAEAILQMCLGLAEEYFLKGEHDLAEDMLRNAEQISSEARKEFQLGIIESTKMDLKNNKFPDAKAKFEALLTLDKNNVGYLVCLGESLLGMGQKGQAKQVIEKALSSQENAEDLHIYERMGIIAFNMLEHELALTAFDRAVSLFPMNQVLFYRIAVIHVGRGQFQSGLVNIQKALRLEPTYPEAKRLSQKIEKWLKTFEGWAKDKDITP